MRELGSHLEEMSTTDCIDLLRTEQDTLTPFVSRARR